MVSLTVGFGEKLVVSSLHVCNRNSSWGGLIGYIAIPVSQLIPSSVCRFIPRFRFHRPQLTVRKSVRRKINTCLMCNRE